MGLATMQLQYHITIALTRWIHLNEQSLLKSNDWI